MASPAPSSLRSPEQILSTLYLSLWVALDAIVGESKWFDVSVVSAEAKMQDVDSEAKSLRRFAIRDKQVLQQVDQDISVTKNWIANLAPSSPEQLSKATTFLGHLRDLGLRYRKPNAGVDLLATGR